MNYSNVTGLAWTSSEKTALNCTVTLPGIGTVPFTASPDDETPHGQDIYQRAVNGDFGPIADYTPPPAPPVTVAGLTAHLANIRWQRETDGITANGMAVPTDDKTQSRLTSAQSAFDKGLVTSVSWKLSPGVWASLDATQLSQIAAAVTGHVAACFDAEKEVSDQIAAAPDADALAALDLATEFEAAYQAAITA